MPQRTPEEIAQKQTQMMMRELGITDSALRDTLYRIHLKYALLRMHSNTRAENLSYLQAYSEDLSRVLSPEQYDRFMNRQIPDAPRYPQPQTGRVPHQHDQRPMPAPGGEYDAGEHGRPMPPPPPQ